MRGILLDAAGKGVFGGHYKLFGKNQISPVHIRQANRVYVPIVQHKETVAAWLERRGKNPVMPPNGE
jgi:hypothetical protein